MPPKKIANRRPTAIMQRSFKASVKPDGVLELLVYEDIGENFWDGSGVTVKNFKQQLDGNSGYNRIAIRINSPGGDCFEGIAIHNVLRASGKPVDVYIDGIAASAASIIAMAGDTITMGSNTMMMIHNASSFVIGYADDMRKMADVLDKVSLAAAQTYIDRAGMSAEDVKAMMDAESWLGAQECVDKGLATAIARNDENDDAAMALARSFKALAHMKHVPETLKPVDPKNDAGDDCTCYCAPCQDGRCVECECRGCDSTTCGADNCNCAGSSQGDDGDIDDKAELEHLEDELQLMELRSRI
jgi:ATP-dependent protease ClpP protease subunit